MPLNSAILLPSGRYRPPSRAFWVRSSSILPTGGGEGKLLCCIFGYVCGFEDTVEGVIAVMGRAAFEVSAADEVAGFVVAVATFDEGPGWGLPWRASDGLGRCVFECAGCF